MNSLKITTYFAITGLIAILAPVGASAQDVEHGRISYAAESGMIKGVDDDEWAFAGLNSIVMPGDTIWADEEGVLEVELSGGTFLRLADGSRLDIVSTPPEAVLRGWTGSFYLQRVSSTIGDLVFETPVARVHVEPDSQVRIDVLDDGPTTVSVRWGRAIVYTDIGEPVRVEAGERSYIDPGYLPSTPEEFDRSIEDTFDTWNRDRARQIAFGSHNVPIATAGSASAPIGVSDLNAYGEWVYVDDQTYWRPTVVQDYVPYRNGYWSYVPAQGYVWVGYHPFAYVTSHHGYWSHHDHYGWLWSYHHAYSPAYVFSVHYGDQFIWTPIDPYGHPVIYGHGSFTIGGIHFSLGFSTFSYSHDLLGGHHYSHALQYSHIQHHHNDYHYWNIHAHDSRYDSHVRPNWPRDRVRNYSPQRVLRGPSQNRDGTHLARERVARLETRTARDRFTVTNPRQIRGIRTASAPRDRKSTVRDVRIRPEALTRTARRAEAARPGSNAPLRGVRTITNRDTRNAPPLSRVHRGGNQDRSPRGINTGRTAPTVRNRKPAGSSIGTRRGNSIATTRPTVATRPTARPKPQSITQTRSKVSRSTTTRTAPGTLRTNRGTGTYAPPVQRNVRPPSAPRTTVSRPSVTAPTNPRQTVTSTRTGRSSTVSRPPSSSISTRQSAPRSSVSRSSVSAPRPQNTYRAPAPAPSRRSAPSVSSRSSSAPRMQSAPRSSPRSVSRAPQSGGSSRGRSSSVGGRTGRR